MPCPGVGSCCPGLCCSGSCCPAGEFFGEVGGSCVVAGEYVVEMPDRCVAVGGPAGVVAGLDEAPQPGREEPGPGIDGDKLPGSGGGEEAPQPDPQIVVPGKLTGFTDRG